MSEKVVRLVTQYEPPPKLVRACTTCRHRQKDSWSAAFDKCMAVGTYVSTAREGECDHGTMWEPIPPPVPLLERLHRWLVG
jgi:hypothetical protein